MTTPRFRAHTLGVLLTTVIALSIASVGAQDRLRSMPGYDQFQKMQPQIAGSWVTGAVSPRWDDASTGFTYTLAGKGYRFDLATMKAVDASDVATGAAGRGARGAGAGGGGGRGAIPPAAGQQAPPAAGRGAAAAQNGGQTELTGRVNGCPSAAVSRGRQADCVVARDAKHKAFYRDRNLWVADFDGSNEKQITTDGSEKLRIKYGTASWVYGEELGQTTAIWWSPDSTKVGFYRFDESQVKDFYLQLNQTQIQDTIDTEAYPKPGAPNPVADIYVYDVTAGKTAKMDARDGKPFDDAVVGHYVYDVRWSPDGTELMFERANRRQQIVELTACAPTTGKCRMVVHEQSLTGWLNTDVGSRSSPMLSPRWLTDGKRFIWESERSGWKNYYLYDITGKLITPITNHTTFEAANIIKVDEANNLLFYTARDGDNYLKVQLHRVGLDGKGDVRLTDPTFTHTATISPDNKYIVDVYQTHDQPPATQLLDNAGKVVAQLAKSDLTNFDRIGFKKAEQFSYKAADGKTTLYGQIAFPSNFDPSKKYPTLVPVYGGPVLASNIATENFAAPSANTEYGFLVVTVSYRGVPGTGKAGADALYLKLGVTEIDDMAEGVKALWTRPYFDKARVGIYGSSYGGYTSAMEIVRHPDVFSAASASSPPTDWRNYDTIYTERYMWTPEGNKEGYDAGKVMTYAANLRGRLLIYYGSGDNNVHPNNSMQLIRALQQAGKSFEVQVGPDQPHSAVNNQRMMEFFIENLVMSPERLMAK